MHLTPKFFFAQSNLLVIRSIWAQKIFEFAWIFDFLCPLKVALEVLHDRVLGSLGRRLLMTSTQEPNTMAPQSALCICSRKWKAKLIVPIYFGTKTSQFCLRIISFSSLESELIFDSKDSKINFDRARSITVKSLLGAVWEHFTIFQATTGKTSLPTSCLYVRNGKLDTKWRRRKTKTGKKTQGLLWMVNCECLI